MNQQASSNTDHASKHTTKPKQVRIHKPPPVTPQWNRDCFCQSCRHTMQLVCIRNHCVCCTTLAKEHKTPTASTNTPDPDQTIACTCKICQHGEKATCLRLKCRCCVQFLIYRDEHI